MKAVFVSGLGADTAYADLAGVLGMDRGWLLADLCLNRDEEKMVSNPPRRLACDAEGRIGEVMGTPQPGSRRICLRPVGGGREWDVLESEITYLDAEGEPISAAASGGGDIDARG